MADERTLAVVTAIAGGLVGLVFGTMGFAIATLLGLPSVVGTIVGFGFAGVGFFVVLYFYYVFVLAHQ